MKTERLDKVLSKSGFGSRKDVKKMLHSRGVAINGDLCTCADQKIDLEKDVLTVDGEAINLRQNVYLMMNKCQNVVCSSKDGLHETVFDLLDDEYKHDYFGGELHCTGRLDIDTEGLLILTTDGTLTHKLISPKHNIGKVYFVKLKIALTESEQKVLVSKFADGFEVPPESNEASFFAKASELDFLSCNSCTLKIFEGKFHQVKRMFAAMQNEVTFLKRLSIGPLVLDESLKPGEYRELSEDELESLRSL